MSVHIQSKHEGKKYQCNICNKEYKRKTVLLQHTKTKHENRTFKCNMCDFSSAYKGNLNKHINSSHFNEIHRCEKCNMISTNKYSLLWHMKRQHQESENVICVKCNKAIKQSNINVHIKNIHSDEVLKYSCNTCVFETKYKNSLKSHIKKVHMKVA